VIYGRFWTTICARVCVRLLRGTFALSYRSGFACRFIFIWLRALPALLLHSDQGSEISHMSLQTTYPTIIKRVHSSLGMQINLTVAPKTRRAVRTRLPVVAFNYPTTVRFSVASSILHLIPPTSQEPETDETVY